MPSGEIAFDDAVYGHISFRGEDIRDWIILRSDGTPTYNFSVVVDDVDMGITHVMRGDDHISNTPKQIAVYRALGAKLPVFAHLPMIHGKDGKKLSKRHGATAVADYQKLGILPAAMRNFLALLGFSPGGDRELFFDVNELIQAFSIEGIQKKSAIFDPTKLEWMNGQFLSRTPGSELVDVVAPLLAPYGLDPERLDRQHLARVVDAVKERSRTTLDVARQAAVRLKGDLVSPDPKAQAAIAGDVEAFRSALAHSRGRLEAIPQERWQPDVLEAELRALAQALALPAGRVFQPIRIALTGATVSEPVHQLLAVVGREESLRRLEAAQSWDGRA
jgi:glutamyl-tRNA synthetase